MSSRLQLSVIVIALLGVSVFTVFIANTEDGSRDLIVMTNPLQKLGAHEHHIEHGDDASAAGHGVIVFSDVIEIERDMRIREFAVEIVNAPKETIHHMSLQRLNGENVCEGEPEFIALTGQDAPPRPLPSPYAILLKKGDQVMVSGMLHNPLPPLGTGKEYYNVSIGFRAIEDSKRTKEVIVKVIALGDSNDCEKVKTNYTFTVPPLTQTFTIASNSEHFPNVSAFKTPGEGILIAADAHFHAWEGGKKVILYQDDEELHTYTSLLRGESTNTWVTPGKIYLTPFSLGDIFSLQAEYTNPYEVPLTGPMGVSTLFISYD